MTQRLPIRQAPARDAALPALDDVRRQLEEQHYVDLRITRDQTPTGSPRIFSSAPPVTDTIPLLAGVSNVLSHGLGRPARHVQVTLLGDARVWLEPSPPEGLDPAQVLSLRCSSDVNARVRAR